MSSDVVIGYDGKPRCAWTGADDTAASRYHDKVWGTRTYDESAMFEALTLGVFEVGLSWSIVFRKRDAFRTAFLGFEVARTRAPRSIADVPTSTPQSEAFAKQLKSQGYRFVGPTSVYAFMQRRRGQRPPPRVLPRCRLPRRYGSFAQLLAAVT